jgi:hypothetical protein
VGQVSPATIAALVVAFLVTGCNDGPARPVFDQAGQDEACSKAVARLAPGMTYGDALGLVNAPLTSGQVAGLLDRQGDAQGAEYWRGQDSAKVYLCTFAKPVSTEPEVLTAPPIPCPPGEIPVVNGLGEQRTFYVDAEGHATEVKLPLPQPEETCSPG